jgi:hypothetical protein
VIIRTAAVYKLNNYTKTFVVLLSSRAVEYEWLVILNR